MFYNLIGFSNVLWYYTKKKLIKTLAFIKIALSLLLKKENKENVITKVNANNVAISLGIFVPFHSGNT